MEEQPNTPPAGPTSSVWRLLRELAVSVLPALVLALMVHVYVAEAVTIQDGPSMQPNLYIGYRVMTEKLSYYFHPPRRGDVVVVDRSGDEVSLIKRVVAVAGEIVQVRNGHTWVDGRPLSEPWVTYFGGPDYPATVVPPNHVFVLGDNRSNSFDSRSIGPVPLDKIRGRAWLIYWPFDHLRLLP
jgi:signal peptidase I